MTVLYNTRTSRADLPYAHESDLLKMAEQCDYLVAACPGGAATRHIINAEVLRALGSQGFVVNVARGSVVNTADLVHALQSGVIAGAGLDVFEGEPSIPEALKAMDNVLLTPHMAGRSPAAHRAQTDVLLASFADALEGRRPEMVVTA